MGLKYRVTTDRNRAWKIGILNRWHALTQLTKCQQGHFEVQCMGTVCSQIRPYFMALLTAKFWAYDHYSLLAHQALHFCVSLVSIECLVKRSAHAKSAIPWFISGMGKSKASRRMQYTFWCLMVVFPQMFRRSWAQVNWCKLFIVNLWCIQKKYILYTVFCSKVSK